MTEVTLVLRPPAASRAIAASLLAGSYSPVALKPEELAASNEDLARVANFADQHHLRIVQSDATARTVRVSGSDVDIETALGLQTGALAAPNHKVQAEIPAELKGAVIAILGLDQSPVARHHAADQ